MHETIYLLHKISIAQNTENTLSQGMYERMDVIIILILFETQYQVPTVSHIDYYKLLFNNLSSSDK